MNANKPTVEIAFRIPGKWAHPGELVERLPDDVRLTPEALVLSDGTEIDMFPMAPDDQFPQIFRSSCRAPAARDELAIVDRYTVNVGLCGPGGSMAAARSMMHAGAAIVKAGGAGVFIDNCGLSHGGRDWLGMADDGSSDAVSFAFVSLVGNDVEVCTTGMHVMGFPELIMRRVDLDDDGDTIIEMIRYVCSEEKPVGVGHLICDEQGPRFQAVAAGDDDFPTDSPLHNPFGRLKLLTIKDVAEGN